MCFAVVMRLAPLKLRRGDRAHLEATLRSRTVEARVAQRARLVLMAADGWSNRDIGETVNMHYNQVAVWRKRYVEFGLAGLEDEERTGRPHVYDHDDVLLLVKLVTEEPPEGATRWTMEALAQAMAAHGVPISASQAWRICKSLDVQPWQVESSMTSHDPDFWAKASDVCGLYLDPPANAVVWSVDEKSGMQAKSPINQKNRAIQEELESSKTTHPCSCAHTQHATQIAINPFRPLENSNLLAVSQHNQPPLHHNNLEHKDPK